MKVVLKTVNTYYKERIYLIRRKFIPSVAGSQQNMPPWLTHIMRGFYGKSRRCGHTGPAAYSRPVCLRNISAHQMVILLSPCHISYRT